ncbi:MAG: hypothetical protein DIU71_10680 [Proteobacteria bacterium]|nr:MAG: hypothetical protein DIU71_10680 [Pseudomonadota bacterium]
MRRRAPSTGGWPPVTDVLVVRLHPAGPAPDEGEAPWSRVEWLTVGPSGDKRGAVGSGTLAEAAAHAPGRKVIGLVPGTGVLLAEPVLPVKSSAKLAQVVPFAIEDQLATDVEELHFALGRRKGTASTPVAAVAHERMSQWLSAFSSAGLHLDALYAETAALPVTPNGVSLLIDGPRVYVRRENAPGAVLDVEPLIEGLQLALASGEEAREHVTLWLTEEVYERERDLLEGLREFTASLQFKLLAEGALPLLAAQAMQTPPVNLLQGPYAVKRRLQMSFSPWRHVAALAVACFALHLGVKGWQYFSDRRTEAELDAQIAELFQAALPGAPVPDALRARSMVEARLAALRGTGPAGGLMAALDTLGEAISQTPDTQIEALSYRNNVTDLRVTAPSVDALDRIQQVAAERGVAAEIQAANPRDSRVEGRLQFKSPG